MSLREPTKVSIAYGKLVDVPDRFQKIKQGNSHGIVESATVGTPEIIDMDRIDPNRVPVNATLRELDLLISSKEAEDREMEELKSLTSEEELGTMLTDFYRQQIIDSYMRKMDQLKFQSLTPEEREQEIAEWRRSLKYPAWLTQMSVSQANAIRNLRNMDQVHHVARDDEMASIVGSRLSSVGGGIDAESQPATAGARTELEEDDESMAGFGTFGGLLGRLPPSETESTLSEHESLGRTSLMGTHVSYLPPLAHRSGLDQVRDSMRPLSNLSYAPRASVGGDRTAELPFSAQETTIAASSPSSGEVTRSEEGALGIAGARAYIDPMRSVISESRRLLDSLRAAQRGDSGIVQPTERRGEGSYGSWLERERQEEERARGDLPRMTAGIEESKGEMSRRESKENEGLEAVLERNPELRVARDLVLRREEGAATVHLLNNYTKQQLQRIHRQLGGNGIGNKDDLAIGVAGLISGEPEIGHEIRRTRMPTIADRPPRGRPRRGISHLLSAAPRPVHHVSLEEPIYEDF